MIKLSWEVLLELHIFSDFSHYCFSFGLSHAEQPNIRYSPVLVPFLKKLELAFSLSSAEGDFAVIAVEIYF